MRHLWKSYGLAHFCTSLMSYALCANSSTIRLKLQTCELGRIVDKYRYRGASLNLPVLIPRPCARLQSIPVRRYCAYLYQIDSILFRTNRGPSLGRGWSLYSATGMFKTLCLHSGKILALGCSSTEYLPMCCTLPCLYAMHSEHSRLIDTP